MIAAHTPKKPSLSLQKLKQWLFSMAHGGCCAACERFKMAASERRIEYCSTPATGYVVRSQSLAVSRVSIGDIYYLSWFENLIKKTGRVQAHTCDRE